MRRLLGLKTEIMTALYAAVAVLTAFDVWMPTDTQLAALAGVAAAGHALLVGYYRRPG